MAFYAVHIYTLILEISKEAKIVREIGLNISLKHCDLHHRLRLDRSTALYIYKAKNCKLLVLFTYAQKTKFIFK